MIGYSINIGVHAWYRRLAPAAVATAAHRGAELVTTDADGDANLQVEQIHGLLDKGARVLAVSPMDPQGLDGILERCAASGVPVITESIQLDDPRVASHLGINEYAVGARLGFRVGQELATRETVRVLTVGFPPYAEAADREAGFLSGLRRFHEQLEVLCTQGGGTTPVAAEHVRGLLSSHGSWSPEIVFGVDDEVLVGALQALEEVGEFPQLTATFGISPPNGPALLEDGTLSWGAAMLPELHGQVLGSLCLSALAGEQLPREVRPEAAIVTSSGVAEGWDQWYAQNGDEFAVLPHAARCLLPSGFRLSAAGTS